MQSNFTSRRLNTDAQGNIVAGMTTRMMNNADAETVAQRYFTQGQTNTYDVGDKKLTT